MLTDDERKTLTEAAKLLALDGMLDAAAGRASGRRHRLPPRGAVMRRGPHNLTPPGPTCPCDHCDYSRRRNASAMWWIARGLRWLAGFDRGGN